MSLRSEPPFYVGVAGWSVPSALAGLFASGGTHLERYGARFSAVEINSSFYRPHRRATYERWAASVPDTFRFAVKLPRSITHEHRLIDCEALVARFVEETGGLGGKRGPVLVQLPPSFAYPGDTAERFLDSLAAMDGPIVMEPRHASWFTPEVDRMLDRRRVSRVAADPAKPPPSAQPGGWGGLAYFRLHGSPQIYESSYPKDAIAAQAATVSSLRRDGTEVWTIYDNTKHGAATDNALQLVEALG